MRIGNTRNPYLAALKFVQQNHGCSGQVALAKAILSIYNPRHAFSIAEILDPLDQSNAQLVLRMIKQYVVEGETPELRETGRWVYENFPGLIEISEAMAQARFEVLCGKD